MLSGDTDFMCGERLLLPLWRNDVPATGTFYINGRRSIRFFILGQNPARQSLTFAVWAAIKYLRFINYGRGTERAYD
jgi:hypothetical protein